MTEIDSPRPDEQASSASSAKKAEKPEFEEFCRLLSESAHRDVARARRVTAVRKLLNGGFRLREGEPLIAEHAHAVFAALAESDLLDDLALSLISSPPSTRQPLARAIRNRLQSWMLAAVDYPTQMGPDRLFEIKHWLRSAARAAKGADGRQCPDEWIKRAFVVLAGEPEPDRYAAVHELIKTVAVHRESPTTHSADPSARYLGWVANRLAAGKISELLSNRILSHPVWLEQGTLRETQRQSNEARMEYQLKFEAAAADAAQLQRDLEALQSQVRELEEIRVTLVRDLDAAHANADRRVTHVEHEWQQRLTAQRHGVAKKVLHDLEEAALCLDRIEPNVEMALNRIREAERVIREQG